MENNRPSIPTRQGHDTESIAWGYAEHLKFTLGVDRYSSSNYDRYMALALTVRDRLMNQWMKTQQTHYKQKVKRVYYLSLEFLIGRSMGNNVINMHLQPAVEEALSELGYSWEELREEEIDAGLGNGGLGRLAACFLDSLATLNLPSFGYGLRYDFGIFRQQIENGWQVEQPDDWLRRGNPWEIERPDIVVPVHFGGRVDTIVERGRRKYHWVDTTPVLGIAFDTPIVGFGGETVNTLRLWSARAAEEFDFSEFNEGDYVEAVAAKVSAENLTKVLYPNDKLYLGKELRLKQQYLFVACSLADIVRRFKKGGHSWREFPDYAAIQLNDTHPSLAVPELMRILIDENQLDWDTAWDITIKSLGYTNHTLMPEALEKWPVPMLEKLLPRHLQIIYDINHHFLQRVSIAFPGDMQRLNRMSIVEEGDTKQIRMAHLSIVGTHSTNGVAALHTELLRSRVVPDFAELYPERFNNKTNGITQRRWLLKSNPALSSLITEHIGEDWITDMTRLKKLAPLAEDAAFRKRFEEVKQEAKERLAEVLAADHGFVIDPGSIYDVQIKRIHEYKRQLLNALHIVMLYGRIRKGETKNLIPRTFLFAGKAAPGYQLAKLIIKLINNISVVVNGDPAASRYLRVYFIPNYRVSLAEKIFPAAEVSEQISTAGTEASGTGNMKFMCNGALTLGTLDGANIEIIDEVGRENAFIFGLTAEEVADLRPRYSPFDMYNGDKEIKAAVDLLFSGNFNFSEPGIFEPLRRALFDQGDFYMHLADLRSYADAQKQVQELYRNRDDWNRKAILNIAHSGNFSSDRTIRQYAEDIWNVQPCPVDTEHDPINTLEEARK
ncbi:glycogen/starch/alpha-glucan phosphorylase [Marispirochaeta aestuarii]|uniref:glycogen/starch/alpha-glucan phosphorylase n=1 Tax=Marispirochaeta aestuarii TaxID=1963862 RepID=UPI0029C8C95E|nr:glycogen/starch/alpha-glucan phosphorylase [Marispirochaeta aestuarii]